MKELFPRGGPLEPRFWAKVNKTETCWLWIGARDKKGYGHIKINGHMEKAHRVAYGLLIQAVPAELDLDHLCRVPACINPDHLEPVSRAVNIARGTGPTARHLRQTHCKRGHEFTPENTYLFRTSRMCRTCRREAARARRVA